MSSPSSDRKPVTLVTYDVEAPSLRGPHIGVAIGIILLLGGLAVLAYLIHWQINPPYPQYNGPSATILSSSDGQIDTLYLYGDPFPDPIYPPFWAWLSDVLCIVASIVTILSFLMARSNRLYAYDGVVYQGEIIRKDTEGGYSIFPLEWRILVRGYTQANNLNTTWWTVTAGYWFDHEIGDEYGPEAK